MTVPDWHKHAACRKADPRLFTGPDREGLRQRLDREKQACLICAGCPVRLACLDYALTAPEHGGVYGGMGQDERAAKRRRMLRTEREAAVA